MNETKQKKSNTPYYKIKEKYSITINPCNKYQFYGQSQRFDKFRNYVFSQLAFMDNIFEAFIEISEPHGFKTQGYDGPRLHLHGTILFEKTAQLGNFLTKHYPSMLKWACVDIDTIDDMDTWQSYCTKQRIFKNNKISTYASMPPKTTA